MPGGRVELSGLTKRYGAVTVLDAIDLDIGAGEFFSLLGPSGCGKTTTLRLVGGFDDPDAGEVRLDGADMSGVAPEKRPVNTVFQSYALFPHQTVAQNVAFGLRFQSVDRAARSRRVGEALELVQMSGLANRRPHQLSGGQQQRVALARALVLRPKVLLLDEPLGALDAKLRRALQHELKALHREVGITFLYVTHDQEEALTLSDRLAVMNHGVIEQIGTPRDVYEEPRSRFVADFLGLANLLPARVSGAGRVELGGHLLAAATGSARGDCTVFIRPERVRLVEPGDGVPAVIRDVVFVGALTHVAADFAGVSVQVVVANDGSTPVRPPGAECGLVLAGDALRVLEA